MDVETIRFKAGDPDRSGYMNFYPCDSRGTGFEDAGDGLFLSDLYGFRVNVFFAFPTTVAEGAVKGLCQIPQSGNEQT
ncbi:MAG: hypothetical protein AB9842_07855 [Bacteroidales bacterium]